jgi:transglutaminase-like putative cysteine protease
MLFNVSCELSYTVSFPSTLILNIHAQRNACQTVVAEQFSVEPKVRFSELPAELSGNRFVRIETGRRKELLIRYSASVSCEHQVIPASQLQQTPIAHLGTPELAFLFPSRYCQSDRLGRLAWDLFGQIQNPYDKVVAIADWIYSNVEYLRGSTNSLTSAFDTVTQRTGVCRDFAHLAIALCRALNIPSRYFTGYAYQLEPPDMHACFECYIGGTWMVFDATRLAHLNGLVRVGVGRDAAEASVASIFGAVRLQTMQVACTLGDGQSFTPLGGKRRRQAIALTTQLS